MTTAAEFKPQFSFTKDIAGKLAEGRIDSTLSEKFIKEFDGFLGKAAKSQTLIALGIMAVPSSEGLASWVVGEGGFVIDGVAYWSLPKTDLEFPNAHPEVRDINYSFEYIGDAHDGDPIVPLMAKHLSQEEYPILDAVKQTLEDRQLRRTFTIADSNSEFWGLVTTDQLRQELSQPTPAS